MRSKLIYLLGITLTISMVAQYLLAHAFFVSDTQQNYLNQHRATTESVALYIHKEQQRIKILAEEFSQNLPSNSDRLIKALNIDGFAVYDDALNLLQHSVSPQDSMSLNDMQSAFSGTSIHDALAKQLTATDLLFNNGSITLFSTLPMRNSKRVLLYKKIDSSTLHLALNKTFINASFNPWVTSETLDSYTPAPIPSHQFFIHEETNNDLSNRSFIAVTDNNSSPIGKITINSDSQSLMSILRSIDFFFIVNVITTMFILVAGYLVIDNLLIRRLSRLNRDVASVGHESKHLSRIRVLSGNDELSLLSRNINHTIEQLEQTQGDLASARELFHSAFDDSPVAIVITDTQNGEIIQVNKTFLRMTGYELHEVRRQTLDDLKFWSKDELQDATATLVPSNAGIDIHQFRYNKKTGDSGDGLLYIKLLQDENRTLALNVISDISRLKRTESELQHEKQLAQTTLASIADAVITTNKHGQIEFINPLGEAMLEIKATQYKGEFISSIPVLKNSDLDTSDALAVMDQFHEKNRSGQVLILDTKAGSIRVQVSCAAINNNGIQSGNVLVLHDVTQLQALSEELTYQATHDPLTRLINRREFESRLSNALADPEKDKHVLCYIDLDQFKIVNDSCGHIAGDKLLVNISAIIEEHVRRSDTLARLGGDEFGLLLNNCKIHQAEEIISVILTKLQEYRFNWQEQQFRIGASIGIVSLVGIHDLKSAMTSADAACYVAKEQGRGRYHVHSSDDAHINRHTREMHWYTRLQSAMEKDGFSFFYQEIRANYSSTDPMRHVELLLRLDNVDDTSLNPNRFLPAAERFGLMPEIDRWVLNHALERLIKPNPCPDVMYAINISGQSVGDPAFHSDVKTALSAPDVNPKQICFEITETAAIRNLPQAKAFIETMRELGCLFALDDFGSGLSSFGYLKELRVDYLKIDGQFIKDITKDPMNFAMVEAINTIGHIMGLQTVAEYVNNEDTAQAVIDLGIDYSQGYHIGEAPRPIDTLLADYNKKNA